MTLDQQYSPIARYWRKSFRRAEMEMKIGEHYAINAKIGVQMEKRKCWEFSGERGSTGDWS